MNHFKEISFKKGVYKDIIDAKTVLPIDVPWVECDLCIGALYMGHTNYWTIIPATIANKRWVLTKDFYLDTYVFNGMILVMLTDVSKIPELNIVKWEELYDKYNLGDLTAVLISDQYDIVSVMKLTSIIHPRLATVRCIDFKTSFRENCLNASVSRIDLLRHLAMPFHSKAKILSGEKAKEFWKDAVTKFLYDFGESNVAPTLEYGYDCNDSLEEIVKKAIIITNQFK